MCDLKAKLIDIINGAVTVDEQQVDAIATHLLSADVMVKELDDLAYLDTKMLGQTTLGALPLKRILNALINAGRASQESTDKENQAPGSSRQQEQTDEEAGNSSELTRERFRDDEFQFTINWNDMPRAAVKALRAAKNRREEGSQKDIIDLKHGLVLNIEARWDAYKASNPLVTQKTPGLKVYRDVAKQVVQQFGVAMQVSLNKVVMCNGVQTFTKMLNIQIENDYRKKGKKGETPAATGVSCGKGVPGVLSEQYYPKMSKQERNRCTILQKELQEMYELDDNDKDWLEINEKMKESYKLQRELIVHCTKTLLNEKNANSDEENEDDEELVPEEKLVQKIKKAWPFLFSMTAMSNHHLQLTGRNLEEKFNNFFDSDEIRFLLAFLSSCSNSNMQNAIMRLSLETQLPSMTNGAKLLLSICMTANHFKEEWNGVLLLTAERTTLPSEVEATLGEKLPTNICIVAKGENAFTATTFYICIDKVCVAESSNAGNALLMLVQLCFILDLEYPNNMPRTFEFFERIILEMTPETTRVRDTKKKILLVLTGDVRKVGKAYEVFKAQAIENLQAQDD